MTMSAATFLLLIISSLICIAFAFDPMPMQDFCVADLESGVHTLPLPCKNPADVKADDFYTSDLGKSGFTSRTSSIHAALTPVGVKEVPGLNTMGLSMARQDFEPNGFFPLHIHQRATEVHIVLEGYLEVGFVTSAQTNYTLYSKKLAKGDMFVVPMGLVHYQRNGWNGDTAALAILNSQNPGINSITHASFGSNPQINTDYLAGAYQLDKNTIKGLLGKGWI